MALWSVFKFKRDQAKRSMEKVKERNIAMWVAFSGYYIGLALTLATVYTSDIRTFVSMSSNILTAHLEHLYCQNIFSLSLSVASIYKVPWWKQWWFSFPSWDSPGWLDCWLSVLTPPSLHGSSSFSMVFRCVLQHKTARHKLNASTRDCAQHFPCLSICRVRSSSSFMWWDMTKFGR